MSLEKFRGFVRSVFVFLYMMVFGKRPGPVVMRFIKNLSFVFSGVAIAKVMSVAFQIYAGRMLGAVEYGKFGLVNSISSIFLVPMMLGVGTALVKYMAQENSDEEKKKILSSGLIIILLLTLASSLALLAAIPLLNLVFSVTGNYIIAAILMAVGYSMWTASQKIYQGLNKMKKLSIINVLYNGIALAALAAAIFMTNMAIAPILAVIIGYIIASLMVLPELRAYFRPKMDREWSSKLIRYGLMIALGTIFFALNENLNKILLNILMSISDVGLYHAYSFSTFSFSAFLLMVTVTVFFPESSKQSDKKNTLNQIKKAIKMTPAFYCLLLLGSSIIMMLYGSGYAFILDLLALFVLSATINYIFFIFIWFLTSIDMRGVKMATITTIIVFAFNITLAYFMIQAMGIYGAVLALIIAYSVGLIIAVPSAIRLVKNLPSS